MQANGRRRGENMREKLEARTDREKRKEKISKRKGGL